MNETKPGFIAYDPVNGEHHFFASQKEAIDWSLEGMYMGIPDEAIKGGFFIAQITHRSKVNILAERKDYSDRAWYSKGYDPDWAFVGNAEFVPVGETEK